MSVPFFLQAQPVTKKLINVELDALTTSDRNGHKMGKWANNYNRKKKPIADRSSSWCVVCKAMAVATTNPHPSAVSLISGRAVTEICTGERKPLTSSI